VSYINKIINEPFLFLFFIISYIPGLTGVYIRRFFFKLRFRYLGKKFYSEIGIVVSFPQNISIGNNCSIMRLSSINSCKESQIKIGDNASINYNVNINSSNGGQIIIGDNVLIASNVVIRAANHNIHNPDLPIKMSGHLAGKITIGNNVWIGSNCTILKDVRIGDGAVIGAGCTIFKDVEEGSIIINKSQENYLKKKSKFK